MSHELTLKKREVEVLKVNIEDSSYSIPLGTSLTRKELKMLNKNDAVLDFLEKYLGNDVMDSLSLVQIREIADAWTKATQELSDMPLGES